MLLVGSDRARSCERDFQNWVRGQTGGAAYWFSIWIFITLLERHASEVREYLAALKARPIGKHYDPIPLCQCHAGLATAGVR
jgi:hypothetical protein